MAEVLYPFIHTPAKTLFSEMRPIFSLTFDRKADKLSIKRWKHKLEKPAGHALRESP